MANVDKSKIFTKKLKLNDNWTFHGVFFDFPYLFNINIKIQTKSLKSTEPIRNKDDMLFDASMKYKHENIKIKSSSSIQPSATPNKDCRIHNNTYSALTNYLQSIDDLDFELFVSCFLQFLRLPWFYSWIIQPSLILLQYWEFAILPILFAFYSFSISSFCLFLQLFPLKPSTTSQTLDFL